MPRLGRRGFMAGALSAAATAFAKGVKEPLDPLEKAAISSDEMNETIKEIESIHYPWNDEDSCYEAKQKYLDHMESILRSNGRVVLPRNDD